MSLSLEPRLSSRWFSNRRRGTSAWGFDIGTLAIKAVRLKLQGGRLRYDTRLSIPRKVGNGNPPNSLADELASTFSRPHLYRQKDAYAVVSFSRTQLDSFELPPGSIDELRMMAQSELEENGRRGVVSDCWLLDSASSSKGDDQTVSVSTLAMSATESVEIAEDLLSVGLRCRVLDGLPFALARAADWAGTYPSVAAIDLGASISTFVSVQNGQPQMIRPLRNCSTTDLLQRLADRLDLPVSECYSLLPNLPNLTKTAFSSWRQLVRSVTESYFNDFGREITRTMSFLDRNSQTHRPEEIWLFGAGATWPGLRENLESLVSRPVRIWSLKPSRIDSMPDDATFGPAVAMAMLSMSIGSTVSLGKEPL